MDNNIKFDLLFIFRCLKRFFRGGIMGKKFQLCGASVILYKDNKVLLQQIKDNKCWGYHGGAVEMGEKVEDATKRELLEEHKRKMPKCN